MGLIAKSTGGEVWDANLYPAYAESVSTVPNTFPGAKEGQEQFRWIVVVMDGEERQDLWYHTGTGISNHPLAKLPPFIRAVDPTIDLDGPVDTDDVLNKWFRVLLGINEEKGRNTIDKVLPYETVAPKKVAAAPATPVAAPARPPGTHVREPASAGPATRGAVNLPPKQPGAPARSAEPVREGPAPTDADAPTADEIPF